ncbi:MAG: hypothetical protein ABJB05_07375 [Parafilimonas sp.]
MKILFTSFFFYMLINAQGQITDESGWKIYYDKEFFFSLNYPPTWEFHDDIKNTKCMVYAPVFASAKYRANIAVDAFKLPETGEKTNVKDFAEASFAQLRKSITDCKVMVTKDVSANGIPKFLVVANGIVDGKYLYFKQLYCLYNNIAYIINYTGEAGIKDPYAIAAGDILNSFKPLKTINQ